MMNGPLSTRRRPGRVAAAAIVLAGLAAAAPPAAAAGPAAGGPAAAGPAAVVTRAAAHPGVPSAVFDPKAVGWASVHDMTSAGFAAVFDDMVADDFLVVDLEVDVTGGVYRVGAVFQHNTDKRAWRSLRDLSETQYAAVWVQNVERLTSSSAHDLTSAQFSAWFDAERAAGRMPLDIEQYPTPAGMRYAAVWVQNSEKLAWKLLRGLTSAQFSAAFAENQAAYRMLAVDAVATPAGQRYAGIWIGNPSGRQWLERRDMTAGQWSNYWRRYADQGFRLISYDRYETAAGTRYAGIWRQNTERPTWSLRAKVDARVQSHVDTGKVPGVSVAIIQNGEYRYLRGFGDADVANDVWLDSGHVLGLASVSKAVAGVLTLRLAEQGELAVGDATAKHLPDIPDHHTHTLQQLADNQGCVQHYNEGKGFGSNTPYATSLASAKEFWADPLVCKVGEPHYSTHGYTILCAALEEAAGQSTADLIRTRLTAPYGLGTLRAKRLSDTGVRRSPIYAEDNKQIPFVDETAKTCGGGMESTVRDLALFGHRVADGTILSAASLNTMWKAGANYRFGWSIGSENGHRVVAKDGANTGARSYLRIYPDDGIVVAVMSNRRGHDTTQLGRDLGAMVLNG